MSKDIDINEIKERTKNSAPKSHYETYQSEILQYLNSKLAKYGVPQHTIMEIAQYCMTATSLVANDEVRRAYRIWEKQITKGKTAHKF